MATKKTSAVLPCIRIGENVFIRTVTHYYIGKVVLLTDKVVGLADAAWVADTGRFGAALATGSLSEVEPYPGDGRVDVQQDGIIDSCPWTHALVRAPK